MFRQQDLPADALPRGGEEIDARGRLVTPGFVDLHTHYDAQATWSSQLTPSSWNGVTTVLLGNCGVGFAPCRPERREMLVRLMEGVEDIPEVVLTEGLPWNWQSFPQFLDGLDARSYDLDVATQVPHAVLRVHNYAAGNLDVVREMIADPNTLLGLGDGGAHVGIMCDATATGYTLTHWTRDRGRGELFPVAWAVRRLTHDNAAAIDLHDRGLLRPGACADINVIDYERLALRAPEVVYDLPAGDRPTSRPSGPRSAACLNRADRRA